MTIQHTLQFANKTALDITQRKCVTWLNSAEWTVLVVSLATCHMHQTLKGGPVATHALKRWVQVEDWKDIPEFVCSFFTWLISRDVALLNWFAHWLLAFSSPRWTAQLGIYHTPTAVALDWQQQCRCALMVEAVLCASSCPSSILAEIHLQVNPVSVNQIREGWLAVKPWPKYLLISNPAQVPCCTRRAWRGSH